jgi:hypothetical protein
LVVNDFGVKYVGRENAEHLHDALTDHYKTSVDWHGALYCGIKLTWDYLACTGDLSMPGYLAAALYKLQHTKPRNRQQYNAPVYGAQQQIPVYGAQQQMTELDNTTAMTTQQKWTLQQVVGTFLYYAWAVDLTMLHALNTLTAAQSEGTQKTNQAMVDFLNYCTSNPDAILH